MNLFADFERTAAQHPGNVSIRCKQGALSFAEIRDGALRAASRLARTGLQPEEVAALLVPDPACFAQAFFAVQALGAVALPMSSLLRPEDVAFQLRHSGTRILVASSASVPLLGAASSAVPGLAVVAAEHLLAPGAAPSGDLPAGASDPDRPAVLIYTSGSTADPKGVLLSHRNLISNYAAFQERFLFTAGDHFISPLPFFHSFGLTTVLLATQLTGATMEPLVGFQPHEAVAAVDRSVRNGVRTVFLGVPTVFHLMARVPGTWRIDGLYAAISGGAALPAPVFERFRDRFRCDVFQGYGLTEAAPVVACNTHRWHRPGTVGLPFPGIETEIRDPRGKILPAAAEGELMVRGPNVMLGYLNNPQASAEALTPDRWLHTGDLARIEPDGYIVISGRIKELIISAGENIHPQEIESVIAEFPRVAEAAVIGVPDPLKGEVPKAFVVPFPGMTIDKSELRTFCLQRLAEIKVPRHIEFLDALPRTPMGKIAKRRLHRSGSAPGTDAAEPPGAVGPRP